MDDGFSYRGCVMIMDLDEHKKLVADNARLTAELAEARKKHRIEWWYDSGWVSIRFDEGAKSMPHTTDWLLALGHMVLVHRDALNLDIVELPAPPKEEKTP